MHIVNYKAIRLFFATYPDARPALDRWYRLTKRARWASFAELRTTFASADFVAPCVVFDIGGNKYRLVAEVNYRSKLLFVRCIMTHAEYQKGAWR